MSLAVDLVRLMARVPQSGEGCAVCAHGGDMSSRRWQQSWPRTSTTVPHGGPRSARTGGERVTNYTAALRKMLPTRVRVQRRTVQQIVDAVPLVPLLDDPVPQMVDTVLEFFRALDPPVDELVIAVPKISTDRVSQRLVERRLPQMVEQLMEVPTVVSCSSLLQRTVEQTVDIPASRGRGRRGGLHVFFPGQSSTAAAVDIPVPRGDVQGFLPGQVSTASSSLSLVAENEDGKGVFRTFPRGKKSAASAAIPSSIVPASVSPWTRAAYEDLDAADEPAEMEDDEEPLIEEEEDPSGWSVAPSASGRPLFLASDLAPLCLETPRLGLP